MPYFLWFDHFFYTFWVEILTIFSLQFWKILDTKISFWNKLTFKSLNSPSGIRVLPFVFSKSIVHPKNVLFFQEVVEAEEAVVAAEDIKNHQNLNSILELRIRILLIWMTNLFLTTLRKIPLTKLVNYFTVQL